MDDAHAAQVAVRVRVDAHLHVWSGDWPYAEGQAPDAALDGDARVGSAEALLRHMEAAGVGRALIVQPINYLFDHTYVSDAE